MKPQKEFTIDELRELTERAEYWMQSSANGNWQGSYRKIAIASLELRSRMLKSIIKESDDE